MKSVLDILYFTLCLTGTFTTVPLFSRKKRKSVAHDLGGVSEIH